MILRRLGGWLKFPEVERDSTRPINNSSNLIRTMKNKISTEDYGKLKEIYALDYALFGYD